MSEGFFPPPPFFFVKPRLEIQPGISSGVLSRGLGCAGAAGGEVLPPDLSGPDLSLVFFSSCSENAWFTCTGGSKKLVLLRCCSKIICPWGMYMVRE